MKDEGHRWLKQPRDMTVPRSVATFIGEVEAVHLHLFAYSSILGCCAAAFAVVGHRAGMVKRLLRSKSRISKRNTLTARLELISGHMVVSMAKSLSTALQ